MKHSKRRVATSIAGVLLIGFLASGCSALNQAVHRALAGSVPRVGSCWDATAQEEDYASWVGRAPVRCTARHTAYTYATPSLSGNLPRKLLDADDYVSQDIFAAGYDACDSAFATFAPLATLDEVRVYRPFLFPNSVQWAAGARWVRCDVGEIEPGSLVSEPKLAVLPAAIGDFVEEFSTNIPRYLFCVNLPNAAGQPPLSPHAVYSDCLGSLRPAWALKKTFDLSAQAAYPSAAYFEKAIKKLCADPYGLHGILTYAYYSNEDQWRAGSRYLDCWAGTGADVSQ
ncbi:MAG: hypothetical protein JWQ12_414 [Glaciihabitans sp.]|nr:hypothetical protein [Glaciihabitans sp.]